MHENIDCIKMKEELQRKVAERYAGLNESEKRAAMIADIKADPVLGPIWKNSPRVIHTARTEPAISEIKGTE